MLALYRLMGLVFIVAALGGAQWHYWNWPVEEGKQTFGAVAVVVLFVFGVLLLIAPSEE